jgi:hypothetical protein
MTSEADRLRRERSAAALRENLKRRKAQVRARTGTDGDRPEAAEMAPPNAANSVKPPSDT